MFEIAQHNTEILILKWLSEEDYLSGAPPQDTARHVGNLLTSGGVQLLWQLAAGQAVVSFVSGAVGVGDSTTAAASGQTDLVAATNKLRKAFSVGSPGVSGNQITFQSIFGSTEANFAWQEMAVFNLTVAGTMLNRAVSSLGTKGSGAVWAAICTVTLG